MKTIISHLSIMFLTITLTSQAQIVNIPDVNFKNALLNHSPVIDTNSDGEIQYSEAEAITETIDVSGTSANPGEITDLTGIEAFINIDELKCEYNLLSTLSLNSNTILKDLFCDYNEITELNLNNNTFLRTLSCGGNLLTSLDVTNNVNLELLQCNFGNLAALDVSHNTALQFLYVQNNQLTELNISGNPNLVGLICGNNQLVELNTDSNPILQFLYCRNNDLLDLDVSDNGNLNQLNCKSNPSLSYINLRNGNNGNIIITGSSSSNFEDLPVLDTVCIDDVNSPLAAFILDQVGHPVTFTEECILSIPQTEDIGFLVFPNPVRDVLCLQSKTPIVRAEIYNMSGQLVVTISGKTTLDKMDVSSLTQGLYLIKLIDVNNKKGILKILKR